MTGDAVGSAAERLTERTDTPGRGGGLRAWGVCVVASAGRLLLVVVGKFAVMFTDRVTDAARPVGVDQRAVERKPAQLAEQAQQLGNAMAGFVWWKWWSRSFSF